MKRSIIIMAKVPSAGAVKTRLESALSPEQCAALSEAFLQDAAGKARKICENVILAYSPREEINVLKAILPSQNIFIEQTGASLGERMCSAFEFAFEQDSEAVVMIGTDSPTLPAEFIERAFEFLETGSEAVLGKTLDGGFYLLGLRKFDQRIFEGVRWSSEKTFEQTAANIKNSNLKLAEIPLWYDVDEPPDLARLAGELAKKPEAAPRTAEYLRRLDLRIGNEG